MAIRMIYKNPSLYKQKTRRVPVKMLFTKALKY